MSTFTEMYEDYEYWHSQVKADPLRVYEIWLDLTAIAEEQGFDVEI